ncbi:hypothetical protein [Halomonas huangheensis]|uniref:DUF4156 domain-containing protein n=1 Tax=Halomonas huangheensis TaxID=1178482 RepID=W1N4K0_9GAMM|nr:hypothetical protein [Halomonas huangheensis]ALM51891.1 hypothetical protein AR456_06065 [Halomonas huangheensis]ERL50424.1 hypothetical protein BJB45_04645 [Halomonas huangheensis]
MNMSPRTLLFTLGATAGLALAGCSSNSASLEMSATDYVVTGLGDSRQEALDMAKERALEQCEAQSRDQFVIQDQQVLDPNSSEEKRASAEAMVQGGTVTADTDLNVLNDDGDSYKAIWTISCR